MDFEYVIIVLAVGSRNLKNPEDLAWSPGFLLFLTYHLYPELIKLPF